MIEFFILYPTLYVKSRAINAQAKEAKVEEAQQMLRTDFMMNLDSICHYRVKDKDQLRLLMEYLQFMFPQLQYDDIRNDVLQYRYIPISKYRVKSEDVSCLYKCFGNLICAVRKLKGLLEENEFKFRTLYDDRTIR